jgi:NAD(P)-dependent dehydrogenase (short-subunit alcohol dehydrogenase family)
MNTPVGKNVLVTGASRGIGLAAAEAFAEAGCDVAINSFGDTGRLETAAKSLADRFGVRAFALEADVADASSARAMTRRAAELLDGLDVVVCNAGICDFKPFLELTVPMMCTTRELQILAPTMEQLPG